MFIRILVLGRGIERESWSIGYDNVAMLQSDGKELEECCSISI